MISDTLSDAVAEIDRYSSDPVFGYEGEIRTRILALRDSMNVMKTELDALPTEAKYEFITWDWKQQIDANELNEALQRIPYARVADVNTGVDALAMVVHSPEIHKTAEEWEELYHAEDEEKEADANARY